MHVKIINITEKLILRIWYRNQERNTS